MFVMRDFISLVISSVYMLEQPIWSTLISKCLIKFSELGKKSSKIPKSILKLQEKLFKKQGFPLKRLFGRGNPNLSPRQTQEEDFKKSNIYWGTPKVI